MKDIDKVLHWENLSYIPEVIKIELISKNHDYLLTGHFEIDKT